MWTERSRTPITKRFIDAFPVFESTEGDQGTYFWETWQQSPFFTEEITKDDLHLIYNHLLASYYNWHFIYFDDIGIRLNVMHVIDDYFPNTKIRLDLAKQLRDMTVEEFRKSGMQITSHGQNPKTAKNMDELISLVDDQTASFQFKSKEQVIRAKFFALQDGIMEDFISRFKFMFVQLYGGFNHYVYFNEEEEDDQ